MLNLSDSLRQFFKASSQYRLRSMNICCLASDVHCPSHLRKEASRPSNWGFLHWGYRQHSCHRPSAAGHRGVELRSLQNADHCGSGAEDVEAAVVGGDGLVMGRTLTEKVAELVVASTEPGCRFGVLEPTHR